MATRQSILTTRHRESAPCYSKACEHHSDCFPAYFSPFVPSRFPLKIRVQPDKNNNGVTVQKPTEKGYNPLPTDNHRITFITCYDDHSSNQAPSVLVKKSLIICTSVSG